MFYLDASAYFGLLDNVLTLRVAAVLVIATVARLHADTTETPWTLAVLSSVAVSSLLLAKWDEYQIVALLLPLLIFSSRVFSWIMALPAALLISTYMTRFFDIVPFSEKEVPFTDFGWHFILIAMAVFWVAWAAATATLADVLRNRRAATSP